jgi:hypothetical protein
MPQATLLEVLENEIVRPAEAKFVELQQRRTQPLRVQARQLE